MPAHVFARCVALLTAIGTVFAQDSQNEFVDPGPGGPANDFTLNNLYTAGSQINVRWKTDFEKLSLAIWQNNNDKFKYLPNMKEVPQSTSFRWTVDDMGFDLADGEVFFLMVFDETGTGNKFGSHYFNISQGSTPTSSSISSTVEATSSSSSTAASSITTSTTPLTTPDSTPSSTSPSSAQNTTPAAAAAAAQDNGLNTGAKVGIGVGVSVGVLGIAIGIIGLLLLRRSRQIPKETGSPMERLPEYGGAYATSMPGFHGNYAPPPPVEAYKHHSTPHEMASHADAQELSGATVNRQEFNGRSGM